MTQTAIIKPLIITEGKTDWMHLKAAHAALKQKGLYLDLEYELFEYKENMGDRELLKICQTTSKLPPCRPLICIFDREDKNVIKQVEETGKQFRHWRSHIYSFAIPVPDHRKEDVPLSTEFYYTDEEIKRQDVHERRLFLSNEFHSKTGRHLENPYLNFIEIKKAGQNPPIIVDSKVFDQENKNQALSKNGFAQNILDRNSGFNDFDFSQFCKIFDVISSIINSIPITALATEGLTNYTSLPLAIPSPQPLSSGNRYSVIEVKDSSHGTAKRYSADLLVNPDLDKEAVRQIIRAETEILKSHNEFRNDITARKWQGIETHVIWLFLFWSEEDAADYNPFCRSLWISDRLSSNFAPPPLKGNDQIEDIPIDWSDDYQIKKDMFARFRVDRDSYLKQISPIDTQLTSIVNQIITLTSKLNAKKITYEKYEPQMKAFVSIISDLDEQAANIGAPTADIEPLISKFRSMMNHVGNMTLPFSENGLKRWDQKTRLLLVNQAVEYYQQAREEFEKELQHLLGMDK